MNKLFTLIICLICASQHAQSQIDGICSDAELFGKSLEGDKFIYYKYEPILKLSIRYPTFSEVKNATPEELLISQMSVLDNEWLSFNFGQDMEWRPTQFDRIKNQDPNKNYMEVVRKITYKYRSDTYAILRLKLYDDRKEKPAILSLMTKKSGERWILLRNREKSSFEFLMMSLNIDYLDAVFENLQVENGEMNNIIQDSWKGDIFSPSYVHQKLGNLMLKNETDLNDVFERSSPSVSADSDFQEYSADLKIGEGEIKTDYIVTYPLQEFCNYFTNQLSEFDNASINTIVDYLKKQNLLTDGSEPNVLPIHKFKFRKGDTQLVFIKYSIENEENDRQNRMEILEPSGNSYNTYTNTSPTDELLGEILTKAKPELIIQLSNGEDDAAYPEINALKSGVRDTNGVLNIERTARMITENAAQLNEYLDE